jgi:hypothetical protein
MRKRLHNRELNKQKKFESLSVKNFPLSAIFFVFTIIISNSPIFFHGSHILARNIEERPKLNIEVLNNLLPGIIPYQEIGLCCLCHKFDFITSCHAIQPSNHNVGNFELEGHRTFARENSRRCLVCHSDLYCRRCHWPRAISDIYSYVPWKRFGKCEIFLKKRQKRGKTLFQ